MSDAPTTRRSRLAAGAALLGAATALTLVVGVGPAPSVFQLAGANEDISGNCDEAEHANDPECTSSASPGATSDDSGTSSTSTTANDGRTSTTNGTVAPAPTNPTGDVRAIDAAGAGTVLVAVEGGSLRLVAATPASGWRVEVEQAAGREVEVDFRSGARRVQVNVELEDGQVRERVRVRDDADGTDIRTENGAVVRDDSNDDNSNSGSGSGRDDGVDDNSGSWRRRSGGDDHGGDDHGGGDDNSGSGARQRRLTHADADADGWARPHGRARARSGTSLPHGVRPGRATAGRRARDRRSGWPGC